ncbi:MAG: redoxin domain-containing protein [Phocaeicola sp.]
MKAILRNTLKMACISTALFLAACSNQPKGYVIEGELTDATAPMVYLKRYEKKLFVDIDSAVVSNGKFRFEGVTPEVVACGLTTAKDSKQPLVFFLANETTTLKLDESAKKITVSGSPTNDIYFANAPLVRQNGFDLDSLVIIHPNLAVIPYFIMKDFSWKLDLKEAKKLRSMLDTSLDGTLYVSQIDTLIARLESLQVGSIAPDFSLPDANGNSVALSSFRGKYVWVDFWASWCPDCRKESPLLVATYEKYKEKNFTMFGVSLDRREDAWLAAIEKDKLTWSHVVDYRVWQADVVEQYAIRWLPTGYLIDPNGVIVAVSTQADELIQKLEEIFEAQ